MRASELGINYTKERVELAVMYGIYLGNRTDIDTFYAIDKCIEAANNYDFPVMPDEEVGKYYIDTEQNTSEAEYYIMNNNNECKFFYITPRSPIQNSYLTTKNDKKQL